MNAASRSAILARMQRLLRHARNPRQLPKIIWKNLKYPFTPQAAERRYDRRMGINTAGQVEPSDLGLSPEDAARITLYEATPPAVAEFLIARIAARASGFTFVDIGAGKGRVLLIAAQFPFARVVGIELSSILHAVAGNNIRRFVQSHPVTAPIETILGDASLVPLPDGPLVLFSYSPFRADALRDFAASVRRSYERSRRKIIWIYFNPLFAEALDEAIFPIREMLECPRDPLYRYTDRTFQALVLETPDP
jgi:SAM-dependent methyltransferase